MRLFVFLLVSILVGCKSNKVFDAEHNLTSSPTKLEDSQGDVFRVKNDILYTDSLTLSHIECNSIGFGTYLNYKGGEVYATIFYWDAQISGCILNKAYKGDQKSIDFVAEFIETIGAKWFDLKTNKFRGEKLFNKLLILVDNDLCWEDDYGTPFGFQPMVAAVNAIKMVDGEEFQVWLGKNKLHYEIAEYSGLCARALDIKNSIIPIKKAWQEGKIVLKDYGEK